MVNREVQIEEERARITALDSTLDTNRTPYLKGRLRFASHMLDDAKSCLRHTAKAKPNEAVLWIEFVDWNIQRAAEVRQQVQRFVETYGGPANIVEVG